MSAAAATVYGTCIALGGKAVILQGPPGSGKSDLALRFIMQTPPELQPALVSDDQVGVVLENGRLIASPPAAIAGKIEVRGLGILPMAYCASAQLCLIAELSDKDQVPRMPPSPLPTKPIAGLTLPVIRIAPFEASAHLKLRLALQNLDT
ncbi:MAG: aldolase [Rhodomicrobium sp.]|nr:aldolase [Rhodomicrobium sp.]